MDHDEWLKNIRKIRRRIRKLRRYFNKPTTPAVVKEESPVMDNREARNAEMNALREKLRKKNG